MEHPAEFAQRRDGVREKEERDDTADGRELAVAEREPLRGAEHDPRTALGRLPREPDHVLAVVDADDRTAGLERAPEEDTAPAADVQQRVADRERQRLEHGLPRERVHVLRGIRPARGTAVRAARDTVGHAVDPPLTDPAEH